MSRPNDKHEAFGEIKSRAAWEKDPRRRVPLSNFRARIYQGWDMEKALKRPVHKEEFYEAFGEEKTMPEWEADPRCMVTIRTLYRRMNNHGLSLEEAMTRCKPMNARYFMTAWGETRSLVDWALDRRCSIDVRNLYRRFLSGCTDHEFIISAPAGAFRYGDYK